MVTLYYSGCLFINIKASIDMNMLYYLYLRKENTFGVIIDLNFCVGL